LYFWGFTATSLQFIIGPIVLVTLPTVGIQPSLFFVLTVGVILAMPTLWLMGLECFLPQYQAGRHLYKIAFLFTLVVIAMGTTRHLYRENALADHRQKMKIKTEKFLLASKEAQEKKVSPKEIPSNIDFVQLLYSPDTQSKHKGEEIYKIYCAACHKPDGLGGGSIQARNLTASDGWRNGTKITDIFSTLTQGIPGTSMISFRNLTIPQRIAVAQYVMSLGKFSREKPTSQEIDAVMSKYNIPNNN
jgi:mono/diheme cytochrome c family protein